MVGTAEYGLSKYLDNIIKPFMRADYMANSTTQFLDSIKAYQFNPSDFMVSFDVVSLFTNVPLKETIDIIANYIYDENHNLPTPPFGKLIFKRMMRLATGGIFMHKDKMYKQVDGVAMGGPLGPTLANFFLAHIEGRLFDVSFKPNMYVRYVDDIFAVFSSVSDRDAFFAHLNNQHPSLKFTCEDAQENVLPFLDVNVKIDNGSLNTTVYRKKTHTGVLLNFKAMAPMKWKIGLIYCLINRAWSICSSRSYFELEIDSLRKMFSKNGYPSTVFNKTVDKFLSSRDRPQESSVETENDQKLFLKVPFIGKSSVNFSRKISGLIKNKFKLDVNVLYDTCKIGSFFSLKSQTPKALLSNVVYQFKCKHDANLTYLGKTKRHLISRVTEHGNLDAGEKKTSIASHIVDCQTCKQNKLVLDDFEVLKQCKNDFETKIHEALLIRKFRPKLNVQLYNSGASFLLKVY